MNKRYFLFVLLLLLVISTEAWQFKTVKKIRKLKTSVWQRVFPKKAPIKQKKFEKSVFRVTRTITRPVEKAIMFPFKVATKVLDATINAAPSMIDRIGGAFVGFIGGLKGITDTKR